MAITFESRYIGVSIDLPPDEVYVFASKPENLSKWATGLGKSIKQVDGQAEDQHRPPAVAIRKVPEHRRRHELCE